MISVQSVVALVAMLAVQIQGQILPTKCNTGANTQSKLISLVDPTVLSCPPIGDSDHSYCCPSLTSDLDYYFHCCSAVGYGLNVVLPILVLILVAFSIIGCLVRCFCCCCRR